MADDSSYIKDVPKLPKEVSRDGVKWLMMASKIIMDSCTVWPEKQNNISRVVHLWYIISYTVIGFGQLYCVIDKNTDPATMAYAFSVFVIGVETTVRRVLCYVYRKELTAILKTIYYRFWPSRHVGDEIHNELKRDSLYLFVFWGGYTVCAFICCSQYIIVPYSKRQLPLQTVFPFKWQESPLYELLYVWQSLIALEISANICALDLFFASLVSNCVAQFKLTKAFLLTKFNEVNEATTGSPRKKIDSMGVIVLCIQQHNELIQTCKDINDAFSYFILTQYLTSMITVCLSAFIAVVMPSAIGSALPYFLGHFFELFLYCYIGNEITLQTTNLQDAVFECGWHLYDTTQDLRKSLVLIMARCRKPVQMSAGGFTSLSLPSFMKVLQFSFSVFTLLNSLIKKDEGPH